MIQINHSALHILDFNSNVMVYSQRELDLDEGMIETYVCKHIQKALNDSTARSGEFFDGAPFKSTIEQYINKEIRFLDFSIEAAARFYDYLATADSLKSTDILVVDFTDDEAEESYIGLLEFPNQIGYTHVVTRDEDFVKNNIINHYSILPSPSKKLSSFALINKESLEICFADKERALNGSKVLMIPECILKCNSEISPKDSIKLVNTALNKVAEDFGQNSAQAISKAKSIIMDNAEQEIDLRPDYIAERVFDASPIMQAECKKEFKEAGLPEEVPMEKSFALRTGRSHKIKTDTGIEITYPADYFKNSDLLEFKNNEDGTLTIEIKNVGKITNKL